MPLCLFTGSIYCYGHKTRVFKCQQGAVFVFCFFFCLPLPEGGNQGRRCLKNPTCFCSFLKTPIQNRCLAMTSLSSSHQQAHKQGYQNNTRSLVKYIHHGSTETADSSKEAEVRIIKARHVWAALNHIWRSRKILNVECSKTKF